MKRRLKKKNYFYQLLVTSFLLLIIPSILCLGLLRNSYQRVKEFNAEYYEDTARLFSEAVMGNLEKMKEHAVTFSVHSRYDRTEYAVFYHGTEKMTSNGFYYWKASKLLKEYGAEIGDSSIGIYYYDADFALHAGIKYSVPSLAKFYGIDPDIQTEEYQQFLEFFDPEQFERSKFLFTPVCDTAQNSQSMLVGVCVEMGKIKEHAIMFFLLQPDSLDFLAHSAQIRTWETYMVLNSTTGSLLFGFGDNQVFQNFDQEHQTVDYDRYTVTDMHYGLTYVVNVIWNTEQNAVYTMYSNICLFLFYIPILLIVLGGAAVVLNYRPVYKTVTVMNPKREKGEFSTILNTWEQQNNKLDEQQNVILELLLNHLVSGQSVIEKYIHNLDGLDRNKAFTVLLLDGCVLDANMAETVRRAAKKDILTELYLSGWSEENSTVIVAFMGQDISKQVALWLERWSLDNISEPCRLFVGTAVEKINDIDISLKSCVDQKRQHNNEYRRRQRMENSQESLRQQEAILEFVNEHIFDPNMCQNMLAEHFQISVYSVSRICKSLFGIGFTEYVNTKRMERAMELLATDLTVAEIAGQVGVADANYLGRLFKRSYGMTPSEYRRSIK